MGWKEVGRESVVENLEVIYFEGGSVCRALYGRP